MWNVNNCNNDIKMTRGDFGIALSIAVNGVELTDADTIRITVVNSGGAAVLTRDMEPTDNVVQFSITEEETAGLNVGSYLYSLDWYQNGRFMYNIVPSGIFRVVDKA